MSDIAIEFKNVSEKYEIELTLDGKSTRESFEALRDISKPWDLYTTSRLPGEAFQGFLTAVRKAGDLPTSTGKRLAK